MAEGSSNQDYGANYTVDDDDFDISSDDDDTFDENDITPRDAHIAIHSNTCLGKFFFKASFKAIIHLNDT